MGQPAPLLTKPFSEVASDTSPDGRWVGYGADETGIAQVYGAERADPDLRWPVSRNSGTQPVWSPVSRELFYATFFSPVRIMVAPYTLEADRFQAGQPRLWSPRSIPARVGSGAQRVSIAADGKRAAVLMPVDEALSNRATFVLHLFDEIRRRLAAGN